MAVGTNDRLHTFEELRTMTTDAGGVAGKVGNVRKLSYLFPVVRRYFVTGIASALMLPGSVGESGIVDRGGRRSFRCRWPARAPFLRLGGVVKINQGEEHQTTADDCQSKSATADGTKIRCWLVEIDH